jgi:DNA (cytosine-5)-methyltransferase 1
MMLAYYNEFKPEAAHMLRQLIKDGLIAPGDVDERSITEVQADDIRKYTQCHFFAGIGGWSVALRLAGWDDARPVWTGSCPCQPFSSAGRQKGKADDRHLWPEWFHLIRELRPATVFGEQVESAIAHGWLDDVYDDMEGQGYAVGSAVLPACAVGKPHQRKRLWFVADSNSAGLHAGAYPRVHRCQESPRTRNGEFKRLCGALGNAEHDGQSAGQVAGSEGQAVLGGTERKACASKSEGAGEPFDVADTERGGRQGPGALGEPVHPAPGGNGQAGEFVDDSTGIEWIGCPDGKSRPVKSGLRLLAHGVQHRAPILHAFGNAIVPQVAAEFIKATMTN